MVLNGRGYQLIEAIPETRHTPVRGVLFDLDDTLNDRTASWMAFVNFLAGPLSGYLQPCVTAAVLQTIVAADRGGYRAKEELFEELRTQLPWRSPLTVAEIEGIWRERFPKCVVARDSAIEVLHLLRKRGLRSAIVTNGRTQTQRAKIEQMGIVELVDAVVISEAIGVKKPDAKMFQTALQAIGVTAAEAIFVGDNPELDVQAPARVGMRTVWLENERIWPENIAEPDYRITSFSQFVAVLARANGQI